MNTRIKRSLITGTVLAGVLPSLWFSMMFLKNGINSPLLQKLVYWPTCPVQEFAYFLGMPTDGDPMAYIIPLFIGNLLFIASCGFLLGFAVALTIPKKIKIA